MIVHQQWFRPLSHLELGDYHFASSLGLGDFCFVGWGGLSGNSRANRFLPLHLVWLRFSNTSLHHCKFSVQVL